ncbi:integrase arm-type DNA-binding domain-containing protein [Tabrizicola sp.]|uniref:tyrosine-type recombinase/integrase n=1 Tax=Tabrizicola sp. TaxID=2005166 RepID=UPI00273263F3|nr:integrase arm-type DNA-binding domain-containing protein [Tabrizicola sp.]MDP2101144.1 integrase arm-type DNA-binding domain-containing protein [Methylotenera sp.]MDP2280918.1 integrase arm-type DNA-binding domain-containing protein [Methylotenera sp.]MDP3059252.1 integrase arm-type DNA-binding domain-containing protein [Methylotenera sp.]MDP3196596.1 integrase arm-type DNA-binding domain-containing protein [Tabrizicola sp.]
MALSDTRIRTLKAKDKPYKESDEKGLFLLVTPAGGKLWRLKYRIDSKEKLLAFGAYPDVSLADARAARDEARKVIAAGEDPSELRKAVKSGRHDDALNSFEVVAREWWQTHMKDKAESHKNKVIRRFELYLFPWLGKKPISSITAPEILDALKRVEKLNKLETAHRTQQTAGQVFRYAVQTGRAVRDVTADLRGALPPTTVKHMAAFTEPKDVAELLRAIDAFNGTITVHCALKLSPLVFARPSELRMAKWADIDLDAGTWSYYVSKTKINHLVPLASQAVALLRELHPYSGHGEYVFMGGHSPLKPMSESAVNAALKRMGYDTQVDITAHGFRAMARTILHERLNIDPNVIEQQLAHRVPDTLGAAYNRTRFIAQRKVMMQQWADYLDELKAGAKIVPLPLQAKSA